MLNYNGCAVTLQALASLSSMDYPAFDIFHIDNGSCDGSSAAVADQFPDIEQIRIDENHGVVPALNRGMEIAIERKYDYLLLLNNDIEVQPSMLEELVRAAESDPDIGCVGPKIYYHADRTRLWSAGGLLRFRESMTRERGMGERDRGQYDRDEEVPYVNGCATLIKRSVLEETGLWDPLFYLALDDADWCTRMKRLGYKCFYAHRAVLYHRVAVTVGGYTARRTFYNGRSAALFVRRYGRFRDWLSFLLATAAALPLAFLRELPGGNQGAAIAKLRGVIDGLTVEMTPPPGPAGPPPTL